MESKTTKILLIGAAGAVLLYFLLKKKNVISTVKGAVTSSSERDSLNANIKSSLLSYYNNKVGGGITTIDPIYNCILPELNQMTTEELRLVLNYYTKNGNVFNDPADNYGSAYYGMTSKYPNVFAVEPCGIH